MTSAEVKSPKDNEVNESDSNDQLMEQSKQINLQQNQLISKLNKDTSTTNGIKDLHIEKDISTETNDDNNVLKSQNSRRLKRKHIPNPLSIDSTVHSPSIKSAPINSNNNWTPVNAYFYNRGLYRKETSKGSQFQTYLTPHKSSPYKRIHNGINVPLNSIPIQIPISGDLRHQYYRQFTPQPSANIYRYNEAQYYHDPTTPNQAIHLSTGAGEGGQVDKTPKDTRFRSYNPGGANTSSDVFSVPEDKRKKPVDKEKENDGEKDGRPLLNQVVDVFRGEIVKNAPFQSQPLSAQKDFFDYKKRLGTDDDKVPVTAEEMNEMVEKMKQEPTSPTKKASTAKFGYIPQQPYKPANEMSSGEIVGSIHFMNEYFYNFKIFNKEDDDKNDKNEDTSKDKDRCNNEKKKFLKLCDKIWDEFVSNR